MAQSSGFRNHRVAVFNRSTDGGGDFGRNSAGRPFVFATEVWASVRFSKGIKSLREGAMDAYDTILIGMLYNPTVSRESMLVYDGRTWQITSFNRDYSTNEIQITATEAPGKDLQVPQQLCTSDSHAVVTSNDSRILVNKEISV